MCNKAVVVIMLDTKVHGSSRATRLQSWLVIPLNAIGSSNRQHPCHHLSTHGPLLVTWHLVDCLALAVLINEATKTDNSSTVKVQELHDCITMLAFCPSPCVDYAQRSGWRRMPWARQVVVADSLLHTPLLLLSSGPLVSHHINMHPHQTCTMFALHLHVSFN